MGRMALNDLVTRKRQHCFGEEIISSKGKSKLGLGLRKDLRVGGGRAELALTVPHVGSFSWPRHLGLENSGSAEGS